MKSGGHIHTNIHVSHADALLCHRTLAAVVSNAVYREGVTALLFVLSSPLLFFFSSFFGRSGVGFFLSCFVSFHCAVSVDR